MKETNQETLNQINSQRIQECILFIEGLLLDRAQLSKISEEQRIALFTAAGRLSRPHKEEIRKLKNDLKKEHRHLERKAERLARAKTGIREARKVAVFTAPVQIQANPSEKDATLQDLKLPRNCYVCKAGFTKLHFFYDSMCASCAEYNYKKRFQTASLNGQVALITGSRLKIGYYVTLMMLRAGARVIATTRFPVDAALRFSGEKDFAEWKDNLQIYGLDLRHTPSVEIFARYIENTYDRLDILINNAAQTVRRPPGFYAHMMANETLPFTQLPSPAQELLRDHQSCKQQLNSLAPHKAGQNSLSADGLAGETALPVVWHGQTPGIGLRESAQLSQIPYSYDNSLAPEEVFPTGQLDADLQQVDLRKTNSWRLRLGEVPTPEMLEVQLVNAVAPFILCNRLVGLMRRDNTGQKHIVNVSAMEGKFHRFTKQDRHPHTNMAKAALNMMTHTSASDFAKDGIFMNAVDTGWVTDEDPALLLKLKQDLHDFQPPLDIVDGAARVCDPFFHGILTGHHWCGKFLKDYQPIDW